MNDLATIIPVLNEADSIIEVIKKLKLAGQQNIIVAISPKTIDNTVYILKNAKINYVFSEKDGYDQALHAAFLRVKEFYPNCNYILFSDAGGKYNFDKVKEFYKNMKDGADLVLGVRLKNNKYLMWHQRLGTNIVLFPINFIFRTRILDISPFRMISYNLLVNLGMQPLKYRYPTEMLIKCLALNKKIVQIPIESLPRIGKSKVSGSPKNSLIAGIQMLTALKFINCKLILNNIIR